MPSRALTEDELNFVAGTCHEALRRLGIMNREEPLPPWWSLPDSDRALLRSFVLQCFNGTYVGASPEMDPKIRRRGELVLEICRACAKVLDVPMRKKDGRFA